MVQYGGALERVACAKFLTTPTFIENHAHFGINDAADKKLLVVSNKK